MKKRSGFTVMARLIGLVKPLSGYMVLAILMGLVGHLCAAFITIFGGFAVLDLLGFATPVALKTTFVCVLLFALMRGVFRYEITSVPYAVRSRDIVIFPDCPAMLSWKKLSARVLLLTSISELQPHITVTAMLI